MKGRTSGQWRTTPVDLLTHDGRDNLVAPRADTQWVRNLRAVGTGELRVGRRAETFRGRVLADEEKVPVLRVYLRRWKAEVGVFFEGTAPDSSDDQIRAIAPKHPAFEVLSGRPGSGRGTLVVDEASQIGLEALPLLALAKKTIVVGDDKQTSPEHVGLDRQQVFDLLDEHLAMIPKYRTLFDPDNSLYDIAFQKFPGTVMLTEHFRCLPPIIAFSNAHAYNHRIIPLR